MRKMLIFGALCAALSSLGTGVAQASGDSVKIGVLNDQSGIYADLSGQGSVTAARMAAEDFGGSVLAKPIQIILKPPSSVAMRHASLNSSSRSRTRTMSALIPLNMACTRLS